MGREKIRNGGVEKRGNDFIFLSLVWGILKNKSSSKVGEN